MKRITIACLTACLFINLPNASAQGLKDTNSVSIFEIGGKPKSAEENLQKLFAHFHSVIDNAEEVELLSYKLIAVVDTVENSTKYLSQNFSPGAPSWGVAYTLDQLGRVKNTKLLLQKALALNKPEIDQLIRKIAVSSIKTGDRIFQLNFVVNEVEHEYFIFIDKDNHVIKEGNLFAFEVSRHI